MSLLIHFSFQQKKKKVGEGREERGTCLREGVETALAVILTQLPGLELGLSLACIPRISKERIWDIPTVQKGQTESGPTPGSEEAVGFFLRSTRGCKWLPVQRN